MANNRHSAAGGELHQSNPERLPREYFVGKGPKGYQRSDERLQDEIWKILMDQTGLDLSEIEVDVKSGEVTLMGTLPDRRMKHRIENLIADCWGVTDVKNQIRIIRSLGEQREHP